jgi:hypothetical protein
VFLSGYTAAMYPVLYRLIGREDLETDPRFADAAGRWENRHEYYDIVRQEFLKPPKFLLSILSAAAFALTNKIQAGTGSVRRPLRPFPVKSPCPTEAVSITQLYPETFRNRSKLFPEWFLCGRLKH